jgi:hypothetical protein
MSVTNTAEWEFAIVHTCKPKQTGNFAATTERADLRLFPEGLRLGTAPRLTLQSFAINDAAYRSN